MMGNRLGVGVVGTVALLLASGTAAQFGQRSPSFGGVFAPVVGEGAVYEVTSPRENKKNEMEIAITGKEEFEGKMGYWLEMTFSGGQAAGMGGMKTLMAVQGEQTASLRVVMGMRGQAFEMDMNSPMSQGRAKTSPTDVRHTSVRVGKETITVPAGTFECEHWKTNDGSSEVWISEKVHPWGLVKTVGKDSSLVLLRQVTGATTKLPPPYKKFNPMEMMRQGEHP
jgi:hypothetical protein